MMTELNPNPLFSRAVAHLKRRLQRDYERAYPELREIIHLVLDEEEANAWELSFPHLFLPDLVEAHVARLNLKPAAPVHEKVRTSPRRQTDFVPQFALSF